MDRQLLLHLSTLSTAQLERISEQVIHELESRKNIDTACTDVQNFVEYTPKFLNDNQLEMQTSKDSTSALCEEHPRINVFKESFFYRTHKEWNSLPPDIRNLSDHVVFSSDLRKYLWNKISTPP